MLNSFLVNDTVRIKVKFVDINSSTGEQVEVEPVNVSVLVEDIEENQVAYVADLETKISNSEYYYDFTSTTAGQFTISFTGLLSNSTQILVKQNIYISDADSDFKPTATLKSEEIISFAPDISPLYIDPEEITAYFPDASLLEIGELIHHYSLEIKSLFNLETIDNGSQLNFTVQEYIKAATCCELSRTYGFGGDDELSLKLADLSITNRSNPRQSVNRGNATTWCQIAAALRKEIMAKRVGMKAIVPKGLPAEKVTNAGKNIDPETGAIIYLSDRELYGKGVRKTTKDDPMPSRGLRKYD